MPRPTSPYDLIYAPGDDVAYPDWLHDVGDRSVFRISGLWEYRIATGRDDSGKKGFANPARLERATAKLAQYGWDTYCEPARTPLSATGVATILRARDGRRTKMSLHSALLLILMLEDFLAERGSPIDIYSGGFTPRLPAPVRIVPYIFDLKQATAARLDDLIRRGREIRRRAYQENLDFLEHMCRCEEMFSEHTCRVVSEEGQLEAGIDTVIRRKKNSGNGYRVACNLDRVVYPI
ncbi:hypothetical protein GN330_12140 [Nitratireductor sp. CAU 1489]|uniref:Uncharacterized protein n=1 Tax=Nitratireductor arenosus TaxID=2682096 RepID=A0A844QH94_9HYPH|nr:hypothetical protein [Nitratireductor arenosus]MVA97994.1 hypothetical protein [Nitratireductor arenosus]